MKKYYFIILLFIFVGVANAKESFINYYGVEMPNEKYEYLKEFYPESTIKYMTQQRYDEIKDKELKLMGNDLYYLVTKNVYDEMGNEILSSSEVLSEEEYSLQPSFQNDCSTGDVCYETTSKQIWMMTTCYAIGGNKANCGFYSEVTWFWESLPKVRSYDIFAGRCENCVITNYQGRQASHINGDIAVTEYAKGTTNTKSTTNGVGISMNLYDQGTTFQLNLEADSTVTIGDMVTFYITYQHAKSNISLANSKSYTFSNTGLGNVVYFSNSSIRNMYDGMRGIKKSFMYL